MADFGDFHHTATPEPAKKPAVDTWGGLVDLGSLTLEERKQQLQAAAAQQQGPSGASSD